ncbi:MULTISPECIES: hypothetical protein [unclassified Streptomyces]|uniref:hypothetical protein n=1 Tax=unclassified Streptomyces TaxID=2593676 RepID=UPI0033B003D7
MSTLNTSPRNRATHTITRGKARAGLTVLSLVHTLAPVAAAVAGGWFAQLYLAHGMGAHRPVIVVLSAVLALSVVDRTVTGWTENAHRLMYGRIHGPRSWSCDNCRTRITARRWTPYDAATFEALLADPLAHDCGARQ